MEEDGKSNCIQILLIRHPIKDHGSSLDDSKIRLSIEGERDSHQLGDILHERGFKPEVYLTSSREHARQTGEIISTKLNKTSSVENIPLSSLTPRSKEDISLKNIRCEVNIKKSVNIADWQTIVLIGHEPRLSKLVKEVTKSAAVRPFRRGEVVCLVADSFDEFSAGEGKVEFRIPAAEYENNSRPPSSSEILRPKIGSKMTVSTFLAGFTSASLTILLEGAATNPQLSEMIAAFCLTVASALFIASVYMYDRMSMPEDFWWTSRSKSSRLKGIRFSRYKKHKEMYGPVYAHMVWTWTWVFTPGVIIGSVGFLLLLYIFQGMAMALFMFLVLLLIFGYYWSERPNLSND